MRSPGNHSPRILVLVTQFLHAHGKLLPIDTPTRSEVPLNTAIINGVITQLIVIASIPKCYSTQVNFWQWVTSYSLHTICSLPLCHEPLGTMISSITHQHHLYCHHILASLVLLLRYFSITYIAAISQNHLYYCSILVSLVLLQYPIITCINCCSISYHHLYCCNILVSLVLLQYLSITCIVGVSKYHLHYFVISQHTQHCYHITYSIALISWPGHLHGYWVTCTHDYHIYMPYMYTYMYIYLNIPCTLKLYPNRILCKLPEKRLTSITKANNILIHPPLHPTHPHTHILADTQSTHIYLEVQRERTQINTHTHTWKEVWREEIGIQQTYTYAFYWDTET